MNLKKIFGRAAFAFALCLLPAHGSAQTGVADLKPAHAAILKKWLATKTGWRLAVEKDYGADNLKFLREQEKNRRPFYVAADFNGDKKEDFAVILINNRKKYAAAVFNAPLNAKAVQQPAFFSAEIEPGDIVYFNENSNLLLIGPFASDAGIVLKPDGKKYKVEDQLTEN